jgi:hypothetical protein
MIRASAADISTVSKHFIAELNNKVCSYAKCSHKSDWSDFKKSKSTFGGRVSEGTKVFNSLYIHIYHSFDSRT